MRTDTLSNQLRWVMLLLAAAVILPTVCLLWFMNQAVRNERLAVRQKLIDVYEEKTRPLIEHLDQKRLTFEQELLQIQQTDPFSFFTAFCFEKEYAEGMVVYDNNDELVFPVPSETTHLPSTEQFEKAWHLEFVEKNYLEAANAYEQAFKVSSIPDVVFSGTLAMVRCYEKGGNLEKAIELCRSLAYPGRHIVNQYPACHVIKARLKLVELYQKQDVAIFEKEAAQLLSDVVTGNHPKPLPSETRVFILTKLLEAMSPSPLHQQRTNPVAKANALLQAETLSLQTLEILSRSARPAKWPEKTLQVLDPAETLYSMSFKVENKNIILVCRKSSIVRVMRYVAEKLSDTAVAVGVFDEQNRPVFGDHKDNRNAFLTIRPNDYLNGWKLCFFFRDSGVFDRAANKQATIYTWTGILVAGLILLAGVLAIRAVNHQIKMNRLKNDFIATVTHELKTPLASMRLLVDTLLEKRYDNEQTATEYLQMVANENKRLTHLIDRFLTFSRMERNKQVFEMAPVDPAQIAADAVESIRPKFDNGDVRVAMDIRESLPMIDADKDGMVTVLVNLLDNAFKYSNEDKQIELKVYPQDSSVCFSITDNGIGLSPRALKKIFNRFFQVDSRLSRRTEGCGLGLSIVKFIVDAHKGSIEVKSKLGQGSVFIVKLPVNS